MNRDNLNQLQQDIIDLFSIENDNILHSYGRMKSTNSIWKKVESIQKLQSMNLHEFTNTIHDFIALRWNMRVNEGENRYDALLNGIPLIPSLSILRFRNQQIMQESGFSCEPIMKFYYVIQNIPIELQLLGGFIEQYMCAKGYSHYKTGSTLNLPNLTEDEQNARLGLCIYYAEQGNISDFNKMMLGELISDKKINYDRKHAFLINKLPKNSNNLLLYFADCHTPVYLLANYEFKSRTLCLTK